MESAKCLPQNIEVDRPSHSALNAEKEVECTMWASPQAGPYGGSSPRQGCPLRRQNEGMLMWLYYSRVLCSTTTDLPSPRSAKTWSVSRIH